MSEETQAPEPGAKAAHAPDAAALAWGLTGVGRDTANAFLDDQRRMLHLQMEEMRERNPYERSHLHWQRFTDRIKAALQVMTVLLGLAIAGALGTIVWKAAHSDGLIVESFTVPPDLAARGLTGQAVAAQLLDRLTVMQNETTSVRPGRSYANNWGDDLKVEIPNTGVSLGEAWRFLRGWLGRETRVSGEVIRTATGIAVTARSGGAAGVTVTGPEADFDRLVQQAAEQVYGATQPYRYASFLTVHGREEEARGISRRLAARGQAQERAWAYNGLSSASVDILTAPQRVALLEKAVALWPGHFVALSNLANIQFNAGRAEAALATERRELALLAHLRPEDTATDIAVLRQAEEAKLARYLGASLEAVTALRSLLESEFADRLNGTRGALANDLISVHELTAAAIVAREPDNATRSPQPSIATAHALAMRLAEARRDWRAVVAEAAMAWQASKNLPGLAWSYGPCCATRLALAQAHLSDFAAAEAAIAVTPGDCDPCLRARGQIAALKGQNARTDFWFARAISLAPSIPFAYEDWGRALLARGDADAAIAQFTASNRKGPHFADPLEGWGEALMAKNMSHLAVAKFAIAEKYAPNWGRLHLKGGEALTYAGRHDEAAKHFARAAALDLTPSETAELRSFSGGRT